MDSFEFNKIAGAPLGTLLLTMGLGLFSDVLFYHPKPTKPGFELPAAAEGGASEAAAPEAAAEPLPVLLAKADAKKGEGYAKACATCHSFDKGGAAKVGPNLYGVVNRPIGSAAGFAYSEALQKKGGTWSFDDIYKFIANPKGYAPGTKMGYAGEKDPQRRADIEAYLRTLADTPAPLPAAK